MHGEIGAGPSHPGSGSDSEADSELVRQSDHGREQHLVRASMAAKIAHGLDAKGEIVIELVMHAAGITKTRTTPTAGDKTDKVEHDSCAIGEIAFENETIVPAAFAVSMDATMRTMVTTAVAMRHHRSSIRPGARIVKMSCTVIVRLFFGELVARPEA